MQHLIPYQIELINEPIVSYVFQTDHKVLYRVRFKPSDYLLPEAFWNNSVFEIVIDIINTPTLTVIPADKRITPTIIAIITRFFAIHKRVVLYICDDSDSRAEARKRKFDGWFTRFSDGQFVLHDLPQPAYSLEPYFASVILRADNPHRDSIIRAFDRLALGEK